jgi:hypothetical protein
MTQQIINIGAAPNDGEGDNLRTAFDKVNENFSNVWAQGPVDSNVRIQGNTISTLQVNQDLALSPNGVGNIRLNNNTIPGVNNTWFLGSTTNRWRGIYVGNVDATSLSIPSVANVSIGGGVNGYVLQTNGNGVLSWVAQSGGGNGLPGGANTQIQFNDAGAFGGDVDLTYNKTTNTLNLNGTFVAGNVTANYFAGNGSQLTDISTSATISNSAPALGTGGIWWNSVDGRAYVKYANAFIDMSPSLVPDPTTYVGNVSFDDITVTNVGNIIPAGNNAYSLGSAAFQWKDLWVSNNTIYINSVPVTLGAGNVLTVDGEPVLINDSNTSISTTGNITANYFVGDGSQLTNLPSGSGGIVFEYDIGNYTANAVPAMGIMQFTDEEGSVVSPDLGTKLFINTDDGAQQQAGSIWLNMATNSQRGTLTLQRNNNQQPYQITNINVYNRPEVYRGYQAGINQIWGDDCSINQIIISNAADPVFYNENFERQRDVFHATNLGDASVVYMVNVYGSSSQWPLTQSQLWQLFESFVDHVIYQNTGTETQDAATIRTKFYENFDNFYNSIDSKAYFRNFEFSNNGTYYTDAAVINGSGLNAQLKVRLNASATYTILGIQAAGTDYEVGDTVTVRGDDLGGATPANDLTATVDTVNGTGGITGVTLNTGVAVYPWPSNSINDGSDDQYDVGNYVNTDLAQEINYGGGSVTAGDTEFGVGSQYVTMYQNSIWCLAATDVDITDLYYSGNLGTDGDGFVRWSGLRNPNNSNISVQYAYMDCAIGTGSLEPQVGETYQVALDSGGINLDYFYSYLNDENNNWYLGVDQDWRLESQQQLTVQSYDSLTIRTQIPDDSNTVSSPWVYISTARGSGASEQYNIQAGSAGGIELSAGNGGDNNNVATLGASGGPISLLAGDATGNGNYGGDVLIQAGGGANGTAGSINLFADAGTVANGVISIQTTDGTDQRLWTFDATGSLNIPGNVQTQIGNVARFQANNSEMNIVTAGLLLDPDDGQAQLAAWSNSDSFVFTDADWTTGQYVTQGGGGVINFTGAQALIDVFSPLDTSRMFLQVNGGNLMPFDGAGYGSGDIGFNVTIPPLVDPTTVETFTIYWHNQSSIEIDHADEALNITGNELEINITTNQNIDIRGQTGVYVYANTATWNFNTDGAVQLPANNSFRSPAGGNVKLKAYTGSYDNNLIWDSTGQLQFANGDDPAWFVINQNINEQPLLQSRSSLYITTNTAGIPANWEFASNGNLTLPAGTIIDDVSTAGVTLKVRTAPDTIDITGADFVAVNLTYTRDFGQATPTWYPPGYNPATDPYIEFSGGEYGIFSPGFGQALYVNTGTFNNPLTQWNINPPLGSVPPTGEYTYSGSGSSWIFDSNGTLTVPGNIVMPTGSSLIGDLGSPAPSISGFNSISAVTLNAVGNVTGNFIGNVTGNVTGTATTALSVISGNSGVEFAGPGANVEITVGGVGIVNISTNTVGVTGNVSVTGNVLTPNLPAFRVYGNGNTADLGNTINSTGNLNINNFAVDYNQGSYLNTATGVFTAPVAGLYSVHLVARTSGNNNATSQIGVMKNGTTQQAFWEVAANSTVGHMGVSTISKLAAGDTLVAKVLLGTVNFDSNDSWSVAFLG